MSMERVEDVEGIIGVTRRIGGGRIRAAREGLELEMKALEKERRGLGIGLDWI